jgi:membrane protein implicated in regulation of membrane protease activity
MELMQYLWLGLFILFLILEGATHALVTIWFAGGALLAFLASLVGLPVWFQILLFIVSSVLMLVLLFPLAKKHLQVGEAKTNVDALPGRLVVITKAITFNTVGQADLNGVIWSAKGDGEFRVGEVVRVVRIEGNKLIVEKKDKTEEQVKDMEV